RMLAARAARRCRMHAPRMMVGTGGYDKRRGAARRLAPYLTHAGSRSNCARTLSSSTMPTAAAQIEASSPIDGAHIATLQATDPADVPAAVAEAAQVQRLWAQLRLKDRSRYLMRAAQAVIDEWDDIAGVIVAEQGRPIAEVQSMELLPAVETLHWLAEEGPQVLAPERIGLARS